LAFRKSLPRDVLRADPRNHDLGPGFPLNALRGKDFSLRICAAGYKAILLAFGLHRSRDLNLPGHELDGVVKGTIFFEQILATVFHRQASGGHRWRHGHRASPHARTAKLAPSAEGAVYLPDELTSSEHDVAMKEFMDVPGRRFAWALSALVCLQSRAEMPASEEIEAWSKASRCIHLGPKRFVGNGSKLTGLEVIDCASVFDAQHRCPTFALEPKPLFPATP
jgi:hypothetical protein